jgi:hypothetical protein
MRFRVILLSTAVVFFAMIVLDYHIVSADKSDAIFTVSDQRTPPDQQMKLLVQEWLARHQ